jgi:ADP-ribosyl-[dinitrogen reductase] hydrolase
LLGLVCGDAVGTTVEFRERESFEPLTDMVGGGPFNLEPGQWTDDTSMALCLAASLVEQGTFDPHDQMVRYCRWKDEGYMSSNGSCFDIGVTVSSALAQFKKTGNPYSGPTDPGSAGNGSIMRLAPVPMFFYPDQQAAIEYSGESSWTTHGATECIDASRLFGSMIFKALAGRTKEEILFGEHFPEKFKSPLSPKVQLIADGVYRAKMESEIFGTGYVVKSLEAALWCFDQTDNFRDAVLKAANLGNDADTTAAICGQLAGAYYGEEAIPISWRMRVTEYTLIVQLAEKLLKSK